MAAAPPPGRRLIALALTLAVAAGLASAAEAAGPRLVDPTSGATVTLEPSARLTHVVFMATWCPECVAELPRLADLEARWRVNGYRLFVVAVATRHDLERLRRFAGEHHVPGRLLFDEDGAAETALAPAGLPTHVLLGAGGVELARGERLGDVLPAIERALGGERE